MTRDWLVKSEPDAFSWDQQVANGTEPWTGVRNHAAKLNLKAMRRGDLAFFYHSSAGKEIVGVVKVVREAYPDPTAEWATGSRWTCRRSGQCQSPSRWPRSRPTPIWRTSRWYGCRGFQFHPYRSRIGIKFACSGGFRIEASSSRLHL